MPPTTVTVSGAGPVGLLTTLRFAGVEISLTYIDAHPSIDASPRAMAYLPIAVQELDRAGVLQDCRRPESSGHAICWRKTKGREIVAHIESDPDERFPVWESGLDSMNSLS